MKRRIFFLSAALLFLGYCACGFIRVVFRRTEPAVPRVPPWLTSETTMYFDVSYSQGERFSSEPKWFFDALDYACVGYVEEILPGAPIVGPSNSPMSGEALTRATVRVTEVLKGDLGEKIEICYPNGTISIEDFLEHPFDRGILSREELKEHYATDEKLKKIRQVFFTSAAAKKIKVGQMTLFLLEDVRKYGIDEPYIQGSGLTVYPIVRYAGCDAIYLPQYEDTYRAKYRMLGQLKREFADGD